MAQTPTKPLIVAFVSDLMFATKINNVSRSLDFQVKWIAKAADIGSGDQTNLDEPLGEKLHGLEGQLFEKITSWQPGLLLFDLANDAIPWRKWLPMLKSSPATRRIPIMAFGPHTNVEVMKAAKDAGADPVLARSAFSTNLPELLKKHLVQPDYVAVDNACQEPLIDLAIHGLQKFNEGDYYGCHDDLEEAWRVDTSVGRDLYRGILQVAIAYYQIERGNYRGAQKMLLRVRQWLEPFPEYCRGVNVGALRQDVVVVQEALTELGPANIAEFDQGLFRKVDYKS